MLRTLEWKKSTDRIYSFHKTRLHKGRGRLRVGHSKRGHERDSVKRLWPFERFWSQSAGSLSIYFKIMPSHISTIYRDLLDLVKILLCSMKVYSFIYRLHFLIRIAIVPKDLTGAKICQRFSQSVFCTMLLLWCVEPDQLGSQEQETSSTWMATFLCW